ncbi:NADH pyrophosphatase, decaps 5'-NAD modified RNA [hydrothermal vent metagenome]|uniref:NAD(+) diphosphatase n=1 Tax=hydrothermal vent metagenome TaxID=652676 RepID=A0A3B1BRE1_9ZZZZ
MTDNCIFAGFPLDPADHMRGNEKWLSEKRDAKSSRFLFYARGRPLMDISEKLKPAFKTGDDIKAIAGFARENGGWDNSDWVFLGIDGEAAIFAVAITGKLDLAGHEKFIDLRSVALQLGADEFTAVPSLLGRGKILLDWNGRRHFCSGCGHKTRAERGGYLRKCQNEACKAEHFPRTDPVVIMFVVSGDKCLLGRSKGWPEGNYSALAGFVEPGETIEEAVRREVFEEAGIKIGRVSYVKSQPWPFPSSLMIGVRAEALSMKINLDTDELEDADWFDKAYLQDVFESGGSPSFKIPPRIALARYLLDAWLQEE